MALRIYKAVISEYVFGELIFSFGAINLR